MFSVVIPSWLRSFLGYLNFSLSIPPWSWSLWGLQVLSAGDWLRLDLRVGDWILTALNETFDTLGLYVNWLYDLVIQTWNVAQQAGALALQLGAKIIQTVYQTISNIYQTVTNVVSNVYQTVTNINNNVFQTVSNVYQTINNTVVGVTEAFVSSAISAVLSPLADPLNILLRYFKEVGAFFSSPAGWIFDRIDDWLNEEV